ncbi:hypothetical protein FA09DRAFT_327980 [Tilletiopsis washingtonensis]|uniref:UspA domain-containing protein n=1 Tax=Tilletiopsis washingtonensis TaxID=58919 RepID=A0A316ZFP1_9BASI|nr:hypothetical protein FA09DRAFT_327980 [Tilletiopsis washingtonensis]PWO00561.1 hypothetical protein FA09DRAFT_327980 [Tilletiopsis washingtonensis]
MASASAPGSEMPSPPHSPPLHRDSAVTFLPQLAPSQTHASSGPSSIAPSALSAPSSASSRSRSPGPTGIKMPSRAAGGSLGGLSEKGGAWERKVGFDTMPDADETVSGEFSYTLQVKSRGYRRTKNTRTFMCAFDTNAYSERALEWLMESLVEDGDEVVALRVLEGEADSIDQDEAREEARELIDSIVDLNDDVEERRISIVVEFVAGDSVTSTVLRMIHVYRPDSLTVGTRGKTPNAFAKLLGGASMGSVSREILSRSPVPVVVVRPEAKVRKHRKKRQEDPKRRSYHDLVAKAHSLPLSRDSSHQEPSRFHGHAHFSHDDDE